MLTRPNLRVYSARLGLIAFVFGALLTAELAFAAHLHQPAKPHSHPPAQQSAPPPTPAIDSAHSADLIDIDGTINPAAADFISDAIVRAMSDGAGALIIRLDTPGGLLSSAQEIVKSLLNAPVPIIVYVAPAGASAASAGTFITEAANIAAMAPGTTIGAAHPVELGGTEIKGVMAEKIENFTASFGKSIAQQRGRNESWMDDAVRKSASISDTAALKLHVIDIVAPSLADLLTQASGRRVKLIDGRMITLRLAGAPVKTLTMHVGQSVLNRLANPNLMYLLLIMGLAGLYLEFTHPGVFLPGVLGAICLIFALVSFEVIPINFAGLLLILIGVGMMVSEVFLTSYGILGMGGVIAFILGSLLLVNTAQTNVGIDRGMILGTGISFSAIVLGVGYIALRSRRGQATTGIEGMVGEVGEVRDPIAPGSPGRIFVHGELWRAVSDAPLASGARAQVTAVHGLEVVVRPSTAGN